MFSKINIFRILEINQRIAVISRAFINEKWLNLGRNRKLWYFNLQYSHSSHLFQLHTIFENQQPAVMAQEAAQKSQEGENRSWRSFQAHS